jgi:hypothetical protein
MTRTQTLSMIDTIAECIRSSEVAAQAGATWRDRVPSPTNTAPLFDFDQPASQTTLDDHIPEEKAN